LGQRWCPDDPWYFWPWFYWDIQERVWTGC
jgi:hypothetical protein